MTEKKEIGHSDVEFIRLVGSERRVANTLQGVSHHWQKDEERFLFISPHDDDVVIGGGLLLQLALREKVPVHILVVTDGSMGYCDVAEKETISEIRRQETYDCYEALGVPKENIIWLSFPDCQLNLYCGRRRATAQDKAVIEGYTGLQNAFTYWLRHLKPTQCFLPALSDLHPDHKMVHDEFLISLFHSMGDIWPELGDPLASACHVHEMGVYCDFSSPPNLRMHTSLDYLEKKLEGIFAFKSQKQIASLIEIVRQAGPFEYLRALNFKLYQPTRYHDLFEKKHHIPFLR